MSAESTPKRTNPPAKLTWKAVLRETCDRQIGPLSTRPTATLNGLTESARIKISSVHGIGNRGSGHAFAEVIDSS